MLSKKQDIILRCVRDRESQTKVAKDNCISRTTVVKYLNEYRSKMEKLHKNNSVDSVLLMEDIVSAPKYDSSNRKKRKLNNDIIDIIETCLDNNSEKILNRQGKQIMKSIDIYDYLIELGHDIGRATVFDAVKKLKQKSKEAYIRIEHPAGAECQFDWGEVKLYIAGKLTKLSLSVFSLPYSDNDMGFLFPAMNMQCLQTAHAMYFDYLDRVPDTMVYDNMKTAVSKIENLDHHRQRIVTDGFKQMSIYYQFNYRFCNIAKGNEKGKVERKVEYLRRKAFCRNDRFDTLDEANAHFQKTCLLLNNQKRSPRLSSPLDLLADEKRVMKCKPLVRFECGAFLTCRVDKYSCVTIDKTHYSVPEQYTGLMIQARVYAYKIKLFLPNKTDSIAVHDRNYSDNNWIININHYLNTFLRKPGGFKHSTAYKQAPDSIKSIFEKHFQDNPKDFIELMQYSNTNNRSLDEIENAIEKLALLTYRPITSDMIRMVIDKSTQENPPQILGAIDKISLKQIAAYNDLLQ